MSISTNEEKIKDILSRGVEDVFVLSDLEKKLKSGKKLIIKFGIDPTGPNIHLGRATVLRKLKSFQDLGHQIVLIIGDFTAQIGDPSDKLNKRPMLTGAEIKKNLKNYKQTLGKVLDLKKTKFVYNSKWLSKLNLLKISELAESFTVQQMLARRNFKDRYDKQEEISLREFLYPLMQGYDSFIVKADIEIGGFDQLFNLKAGRVVQRFFNQPEQDVLTCQMLEGTDGRKMSTSWGNVININDEPKEMYGKIMSMRDELIIKYFLLCTELAIEEIENIKKELNNGANPRDFKMRLGWEIVNLYHGKDKADEAQDYFIDLFQKKIIPDNIPILETKRGSDLIDVVVEAKIIASKSEFRRLIKEGAVELINGEKIINPTFKINSELILKIGKKKFIKIKI